MCGHLLYVTIGLILTVLYVYLAGWDKNHVFLAVLVLPVISFILYILRRMPQRFLSDFPEVMRGFWAILIWTLLPIFSNGVSILLGWVGYREMSEFVFRYRYASLVAVPLAVLIGLIAIENLQRWMADVREWRAKRFLRKEKALRTAVLKKMHDEGKHCGSQILEEYALHLNALPDWMLDEIRMNLESCTRCRWEVDRIRERNLP